MSRHLDRGGGRVLVPACILRHDAMEVQELKSHGRAQVVRERLTVVVTRRLPEPVETRLSELFNVRLRSDDTPMTRSEMAEAMQEADVLVPTVTDTIEVGRRIYHMDFTPRASHVLISANADEKLFLVNAVTHEIEDVVELDSPSGIFGVWRAFRIGL